MPLYNATVIYLDHCATTPLLPEVAAAMAECHGQELGNPSSQHAAGRRARKLLEDAREALGALLGLRQSGPRADRLVFTSGGTEANNLALVGGAGSAPKRLITTAAEHPSIREIAGRYATQGWLYDPLELTAEGLVTPFDLEAKLALGPAWVGILWGHNETGVLQPVERLAEICGRFGAWLHLDAVQVAGKLPIRFAELAATSLSIAAHKFHGPLGIGAIVVRGDAEFHSQLAGGFQEGGLRPGTQAVPLVVGMRTAFEIWADEAVARQRRLEAMRDRLEAALTDQIPGLVGVGRTVPRLPHVSCVSFPGVDRQELFLALDLAGVACSTGSACASGSNEPSPALRAMGLPAEVVRGALRFSVGARTTADEIREAAERIGEVFRRFGATKQGLKTGPAW